MHEADGGEWRELQPAREQRVREAELILYTRATSPHKLFHSIISHIPPDAVNYSLTGCRNISKEDIYLAHGNTRKCLRVPLRSSDFFSTAGILEATSNRLEGF